jgi:two-component system sensor histidine kinase/response regulator
MTDPRTFDNRMAGQQAPEAGGDRPRLLVIDDNADNVALLENILGAYEIVSASSGMEGLKQVRTLRPELVLLDLQMPGMDGFAVLEEIQADARTRGIPVVLLTAALRDPASIARGLAAGATEYLTKPINAEELRVRVSAVLRTHRAERELARLRRDFASMLLHDIRTPLESVRLAVSLLGSASAPAQRAELIELAQAGLSEVAEMTEELIEGNRLEEGEIVLERRKLDAADLAREVLDRLSLMAKQRHMELILEMPAGLMVDADSRVLRRMLANLVNNAIKYASPGKVVLRGLRLDTGVRLEVEDEGPGMSEEDLERAFDRYFHRMRRRERNQTGFGLGLAFVKRAGEAHGGQVGIDSGPGRGTRVWLLLLDD